MTTPATTPPLPTSIWAPGLRATSIALLVTIGLSAFEGLAVAAALPQVTAELGRVALAPWVLTAYLIASAVATLAAGPIVDQRGARQTFQLALTVFVVASVACALAPTMEVLLAARVVQGIGGGALISVALSTVGLAFPPDLRASQYAAQSSVWGSMAVLGPALAALFVSTVGWEAVFWINVPFGAVVAWLGHRSLPIAASRTDRPTSIDGVGLVLAAGFITAFIAALSEVSIRSLVWAAIAAGVAGLWWIHAGSRPDPLILRRHLISAPYSLMGLAVAFALAAAVGLNVILPVVVRAALGRSTGQAASSLLFFSLSWTIGAQIASRVLRHRDGPTLALWGFAVMAVGTAVGSTLGEDPSFAALSATSAIRGLGIGIVSIPYLTELQRLATGDGSADGFGRINAAHQFYRFVGVIVSVAVASTVLLFTVDRRVGNVEAVRGLLAGEDPSGVVASIELRQALAAGYRWGQVAALALSLVGALFALATRRRLLAREQVARP